MDQSSAQSQKKDLHDSASSFQNKKALSKENTWIPKDEDLSLQVPTDPAYTPPQERETEQEETDALYEVEALLQRDLKNKIKNNTLSPREQIELSLKKQQVLPKPKSFEKQEFLIKTSPIKNPTPYQTVKSLKYKVLHQNSLLRSGPGQHFAPQGLLKKGDILEISEKKEEWLRLSNQQTWVHSSIVTPDNIP
jgi:hypothetical protein